MKSFSWHMIVRLHTWIGKIRVFLRDMEVIEAGSTTYESITNLRSRAILDLVTRVSKHSSPKSQIGTLENRDREREASSLGE